MSTVSTSRRESVLWITLDRPEAFNAFDEDMGSRFLAALVEGASPDIRAVVITGRGKVFCAGEDLRALKAGYEAGDPPDHGAILRGRYNPTMLAIRDLRKPVIAAINGVAAGAGVSLALACDLRIMAAEASLVLGFSKVGLVPDAGATWLLPRYLGWGKAYEFAIASDRVDANRALALGLVNEVLPDDELEKAVDERAKELAEGPTLALAAIKRLLWGSLESTFASHLEAEATAQSEVGRSVDHLEGVKAFGEKRAPRFEGR